MLKYIKVQVQNWCPFLWIAGIVSAGVTRWTLGARCVRWFRVSFVSFTYFLLKISFLLFESVTNRSWVGKISVDWSTLFKERTGWRCSTTACWGECCVWGSASNRRLEKIENSEKMHNLNCTTYVSRMIKGKKKSRTRSRHSMNNTHTLVRDPERNRQCRRSRNRGDGCYTRILIYLK